MTIDSSSSSNYVKSISNEHFHKRNKLRSTYNQCFQNYYHSYSYLNPNPVYISNVRATINHWQLRDLMKFDQETNSIYYTKDDSISCLKLNKEGKGHGSNDSFASSSMLNLKYFPRCFNHTNGVIVTGGLLTNASDLFSSKIENLTTSRRTNKGLFSFYNSHLDVSKTVRVGEMINNDVTVYPSSSNSLESYICNNDSNLYCLDINNNDSIKVANKINCEINTCLNNVVRNPINHKILTVTGDSSSIFLVDPTSSSKTFKTISTGHDSGFGISYHPNGNLFSSVFQDGTCLLYDLRNIKKDEPLIEIKSTRPGHQSGAFRVCKFSPENDLNDLLIISEHVGRVHVIDLRNLNYDNVDDHQVIVAPLALDQYSEFKNRAGKVNTEEDEDEEEDKNKHQSINIYPNDISFTAPLVYDYNYLANINPKLFMDFGYVPPPPTQKPSKEYSPPPKFNYPQWNSNDSNSNIGNSGISPTSQRPSISQDPVEIDEDFDTNPDIDAHLQYVYESLDYDVPSSSNIPRSTSNIANSSNMQASDSGNPHASFYKDSYQQTISHIYGEMELSGIEFCNPNNSNDSKILLGCQDAGILMWDINGVGRRSFGSFDYV